MQNGWIKIYRKLLNSAIFQNEKMLKIFIWCLLKAAHKEHEQLVGRQKVHLLPGQFIFGRNAAAAELQMAPSTVYDYMSLLKAENTISIKSGNKYSVVTIENWSFYQSEDENLDSKTDSTLATNRQQISTNKNVDNYKNKDYSIEFEKFRQRYDIEALKLIDQYFDILRTTRVSGKISNSIVCKVYTEMNKYPVIVVKSAVLTVINNPALHSKRENYFFGIMRNTTAEEAEQRIKKYEAQQHYQGVDNTYGYADFTGKFRS